MKKNMGIIDRVIRLALGLVVGILYLTGQVSGTAAIILGTIAGIFVLTSMVGTCPLYTLVGLSTDKT